MATQDVNIVGLNGGTAPDWAKEQTLGEIKKGNDNRNNLLKLLAAKANASEDEIKKALGEVTDEVVEVTGAINNQTQQNKKSTEENITATLAYQRTLGKIGNVISGIASTTDAKSMFGQVSGGLDSLGSKLGEINPRFALAIGVLKGIVDVGNMLYHRLIDLGKSTQDMYSSGLVFSGGMRGIVAAASEAGMSVTDFSKIMTKYSAVGVTVGINRLAKLNNMFLQQTNLGANLMMSQEEASDALLETMEMMRGAGRLVGMTDDQIVKSGQTMLKSFNDLAMETGRNRDEIRKATADIMKRPDIDTVLRSLDDASKEKLGKTFAEVAAKMGQAAGPVADAIAKINLGGLGAVDEQMRVAMNVIPGLTAAFEDAAKGVPGAIDRMTSIMDSPDTRQRMRALSVQLPDVAKVLQEMSAGSRQAAEAQARLNAMSPAQRAAYEESIKEQQRQQAVMNNVNASYKRFGAAFDKLALGFANTLLPVVNALSSVFEVLGNVVGKVADVADLGGGTGGAVMSIVAVLGSGAILTGSLRFLRRLFSSGGGAIKNIMGNLFKSMGGGAANLVGGAGGAVGGAGGGLLSGLGKGIGALGEGLKGLGAGVGKALAGILTGAAEGLQALSNPRLLIGTVVLGALAGVAWIAGKAFQEFEKVSWETMGKAAVAIVGLGVAAALAGFAAPEIILGGAALGIAIAAIGAGIAGASWIMGKALPTLAEGLQGFAKIDGKNLKDVGLGLIALGGGLAAMGAGSVINALGGIASGILGFFQEDPAVKIQRFMKLFEQLAQGKDSVAAGAYVIEQIGKLNISQSIGETINTLSSAFSSHWFSKDLGDVDEGYIQKFFHIFDVIGKASSGVSAGSYVLDTVSKLKISSNITDNIKGLVDIFSGHWFSKDIGDIDEKMILKFFSVFDLLGTLKGKIQPGAEVLDSLSKMSIGPGFMENIQTLGKMFSESSWRTTAADIDEKVLDKFFGIFDILRANKSRIEAGAPTLQLFHDIGVTKTDAEGVAAISSMFTGKWFSSDLGDVKPELINKLGDIFKILGDNTDNIISGAGAMAAMGTIDLSEAKVKGISTLASMFSEGWFSGLNKVNLSLVDTLGDIFARFSFNQRKFIAGADVLYYLGGLEFTEEKMAGLAAFGSMFSQGTSLVSRMWQSLAGGDSKANLAAVDTLGLIFGEFGANTNSFIQGAGALAALNTINIDADKMANLFDLVSNKLFPKDFDTTSVLGRIDGMMSIFDRFAKNQTIIAMAVDSINTIGNIDTNSLQILQNLFSAVPASSTPGAATSAPPTATTTGIDRTTTDYYEKSTAQFTRMIELLELAHADAIDLKRDTTDGLKDISDAVKSSSGRIF